MSTARYFAAGDSLAVQLASRLTFSAAGEHVSCLWVQFDDTADGSVIDSSPVNYSQYQAFYSAYNRFYNKLKAQGSGVRTTAVYDYQPGTWYLIGVNYRASDYYCYVLDETGAFLAKNSGGTHGGNITLDTLYLMGKAGACTNFGFAQGVSLTDAQLMAIAQGQALLSDYVTPDIYIDASLTNTGSQAVTITGADAATTIAGPAVLAAPAGPPALSLNDFQDGQIFQRRQGTASVTVTGDCDSSQGVQGRVLDAAGAIVVDWTPLATANDAYAGTLTVQEGGWYQLQARYADASAQVNGTANWGVGIVIGCIGQSNMEHWWGGYWSMAPVDGAPAAPNTHVRSYKAGAWSVFATGDATITGSDGAIAFANALYSNLAQPVPVGLINRAVGGSALFQEAEVGGTHYKGWWLNQAANSNYQNFLGDVAALGGACEQIIWVQGERDSKAGIGQAQYESGLKTLFSRLRADVGNASNRASLPIMIGPIGIGDEDYYVAADWQSTRQAEQQVAADLDDVTLGPNSIDLPRLVSEGHHTRTGYQRMGARYARVSLWMLGEAAGYLNPTIASTESLSATQTRVHIAHGGGTDFTPTNGIGGFSLFVNATAIALSDASRESADTIVLTHAAAAEPRAVGYEYNIGNAAPNAFADNAPASMDLLYRAPPPATEPVPPSGPATSIDAAQYPKLWAAGLSGGLVLADRVYDAFADQAPTLVSSPAIVATPIGPALRLNYQGANTGQCLQAPYLNLNALTQICYWVYATLTDSTTTRKESLGLQWGVLQGPNVAANAIIYLSFQNSTRTLRLEVHDDSDRFYSFDSDAITIDDGAPHVIGVDWDAATITFYLDGAAVGTAVFAQTLYSSNTGVVPEIMGGHNVTYGTAPNSPSFDFYAWGVNAQALGAARMAQIAADPLATFDAKASTPVLAVHSRASIRATARARMAVSQGLAFNARITTAAASVINNSSGITSIAPVETVAKAVLDRSPGVRARGSLTTGADSALSMLSLINAQAAIVTTGQSRVDLAALFAIAARAQIHSGVTVTLGLDMRSAVHSDTTLTGRARVGLVSEIDSIAPITSHVDLSLALQQLMRTRTDIVTTGQWQAELARRLLYLVADGIVIQPVFSAVVSIDPQLTADAVEIKPQ